MTLIDWFNSGWLKKHTSSPQEIRDLLEKVDRDIVEAANKSIMLDWRLAIAYNASLGCATLALHAGGFRLPGGSGQHYRTIQSLKFTLALDPELITTLEAISKKRAIVTYDEAGAASEEEVNEALRLAKELRQLLVEWLQLKHPHYLP